MFYESSEFARHFSLKPRVRIFYAFLFLLIPFRWNKCDWKTVHDAKDAKCPHKFKHKDFCASNPKNILQAWSTFYIPEKKDKKVKTNPQTQLYTKFYVNVEYAQAKVFQKIFSGTLTHAYISYFIPIRFLFYPIASLRWLKRGGVVVVIEI